MTVEEAKKLNKGDHILYNGLEYKVLHTKRHRSVSTNELFVTIKCSRQNEILWLDNEFVDCIRG